MYWFDEIKNTITVQHLDQFRSAQHFEQFKIQKIIRNKLEKMDDLIQI